MPSAINSLTVAFAENLANRLEVRFSSTLLYCNSVIFFLLPVMSNFCFDDTKLTFTNQLYVCTLEPVLTHYGISWCRESFWVTFDLPSWVACCSSGLYAGSFSTSPLATLNLLVERVSQESRKLR